MYGSPDVLELRDIDKPEIGDDRLLVRMHAAAVDRGVWHLMTGLPYLVRLVSGLRAPKARVTCLTARRSRFTRRWPSSPSCPGSATASACCRPPWRARAAVAQGIAQARGQASSVCPARVRTILHGHRYDGSRATRELGLSYAPTDDTFRRTSEWAVAEGLVTRPLRSGGAVAAGGHALGRRAAPDEVDGDAEGDDKQCQQAQLH